MSPPAICCGTPPTFAMMVPANPPTRNFRPLKSSIDLISLRNQPPIWAPVEPVGMPIAVIFLQQVVEHLLPPPHSSHEMC